MLSSKFDFDRVVDRRNTWSSKWDAVPYLYKNPKALPMWVAEMDFPTAPPIQDVVRKIAESGFYGYPLLDFERAKKTTGTWLAKEHCVHITANDIEFIPSVMKGLAIILQTLTTVGDEVLIPIPTYKPFIDVTKNTGRTFVPFLLTETETGYQIDFQELEKSFRTQNIKVFILCNPHNPTGRCWTAMELAILVDLCEKYDVLLVSDEVHGDLTLPGFSYTPILRVGEHYRDAIITLKSIAKTFNLSGMRMSYLVTTSPEIQTTIRKYLKQQHDIFQPTTFAFPILQAAYGDPESKDWLCSVRHYIAANFKYLKQRLRAELPEVTLYNQEATYLVWLNLNILEVSEAVLKETLDVAGIAVETSKDFGLTDGLYVRMNIGLPRPLLEQGLDAFINGIKKLL